VVAANLRALRERAPKSDALPRYEKVAQLLTGQADATADEVVERLYRLVTDLGIPRLGSYGVGPEHTAELIEKAVRASSMKANPIELTPGEMAIALESAL
jgi:alcohol dehydrogenase class IV